jgi:hypothetical protein
MNQHSSNKTDISLSLANPNPAGMNLGQKLSSFLIAVGLFICLIYLLSPTRHSNALLMWLSIGSTMPYSGRNQKQLRFFQRHFFPRIDRLVSGYNIDRLLCLSVLVSGNAYGINQPV